MAISDTDPREFNHKKKRLRHREFPGGHPSKYYPGPTVLNFAERTRSGAFTVVWP